MKYSVITFGCRVNQADSFGFEEELRAAGAAAASPNEADLVVVNTCSVTSAADQAARQTIRRVARANPNARIVVTGCYASRRPEDLAGLAGVTQVVSNEQKPQLVSLIRSDFGLSTADRFGNGEGSCGAAIEPGIAGRTAFTLRVQTGCSEPCSYCIIPTTRGRPRSVPVESIQAEANRVVGAGFKEIALTGVHLGSYGRDLEPRSSLTALLQRLAGQSGALFRISSLEPMDCAPEIVDLVATSGRFARHFHLPLQHASDDVLATMRRPYTLRQYADLVASIRASMTDASIGSDVIVGFPGETADDFEQMTTYLEASPLTHLHVFPYSDRPGTPAARMGGKVTGTVVRERAQRVRDIGRRLSERFRGRQVGTVRRGLTIDDGSLVVTDNYLKVSIPAGLARNEWVSVKITEAGETMRGEIIG